MSDRNSGESILAFMLGGLVGACLGILYAPQPGKHTRKKLKVLLEDLSERAEDLLEEGKDKVEEMVSTPKDKTPSKKKEQ